MLEQLMGLTDEEFMDSLMVASNIRKLGRMELLYTCVADLVSFLHRTGMDDLLGGMEHYYDPNDYNRVIYHSKSEDASDRIKQILADADKLLVECEGACDESSAYQLLVRVLKEQTVVEESGARRLKTKEDGANNGSIVTDYQYEKSAEYLENQADQKKEELFQIFKEQHKNCICKMHMSYNYEKQEWSLQYDPMRCMCGPGEYCMLRGRPLSKKTGNIYYDLKVSTIRKDDTFLPGSL